MKESMRTFVLHYTGFEGMSPNTASEPSIDNQQCYLPVVNEQRQTARELSLRELRNIKAFSYMPGPISLILFNYPNGNTSVPVHCFINYPASVCLLLDVFKSGVSLVEHKIKINFHLSYITNK